MYQQILNDFIIRLLVIRIFLILYHKTPNISVGHVFEIIFVKDGQKSYDKLTSIAHFLK